MKKFLLSALILFGLFGYASDPAEALGPWRQRVSADCDALTDGIDGDLCWDTGLDIFYTCRPSVGACDTTGEWKAGGGGWIDDGTHLYPLNLARNVGIGTSTPTEALHVVGNILIGANLYKCDASNGCLFDTNANGSSNVVMGPDGQISTAGGYNYTGSDTYLNVSRSSDKSSPSLGDAWYNSTSDYWAYNTGALTKKIPVHLTYSTTITPTASSNRLLWKAISAGRIEGVGCIVDPGGSSSAVINIQKCNASTGSSCANVDTSSITCGNTSTADDGSLSAPTFSAGQWINLNIGTLTNSPSLLTVTVEYSKTP